MEKTLSSYALYLNMDILQKKFKIIEMDDNNNCSLVKYDRTNGNCHVFIIKKDE